MPEAETEKDGKEPEDETGLGGVRLYAGRRADDSDDDYDDGEETATHE